MPQGPAFVLLYVLIIAMNLDVLPEAASTARKLPGHAMVSALQIAPPRERTAMATWGPGAQHSTAGLETMVCKPLGLLLQWMGRVRDMQMLK